MTKRHQDPVTLARQLLEALAKADTAANDDEPVIDEAAIRARARADAERMRRARIRKR